MIIIGEKAYLKNYDKNIDKDNMNSEYNYVHRVQLQESEMKSTKVTRKRKTKCNNYIYKNIKNKASVLKKDKRDIQEKITFIQIQEEKFNDMEEKIKKSKKYYLKAIEEEKQEDINEKIKRYKIKLIN